MIINGLFSLLAIFISSITCLIIWDLYRKRHIFRFAKQFPGYTFYPIIGNGYHFLGEDIFKSLRKAIDQWKSPCGVWLGHTYCYLTADPAEIKIILNHPNSREKSTTYDAFEPMLGNTLLLEKYDDWKRHRKSFAHSFSQRALNNLVRIFYEKSCTLVEKLKNERRIRVNVFQEFTLAAITDSFSGTEQRLTRDERLKVTKNLHKLDEIVGKRFFDSKFYPDFIYYRTSEGRNYLKTMNETVDVINKIIGNTRENIKKHKDSSIADEDLHLVERLMMRNEEKLTDEEIARHLVLFITGSIDTSATALLFIFTLLGMHSKIQEKVYQEVVEAVGPTGPITEKDLPNLKYTEMVIYEALRLFPSIPIIGRHVSQDLDLGSKIIPAGSNIIIYIFDVHRNERYWKDPKVFDPERFLPSQVNNRHPYAFMPFSLGPRNCIGWKYGMMNIKTAVANVIRYHHVHSNYKSVDDMDLVGSPTLRTTHDIDCTFTLR